MNNVEVSVLDIDGVEYVIADNILDNSDNIMYYYFVNKDNPEDYIIQKLADDNDSLLPVTEDEFDKALDLLKNKYYN
ncbi:MAG: hypothetical protein IJF92_05140 [Bacilli bacterium]|nr:hypothetical protein [Bacilli bacterium]